MIISICVGNSVLYIRLSYNANNLYKNMSIGRLGGKHMGTNHRNTIELLEPQENKAPYLLLLQLKSKRRTQNPN